MAGNKWLIEGHACVGSAKSVLGSCVAGGELYKVGPNIDPQMPLGFRVLINAPKYYNPYFGNSLRGTPPFGNAPGMLAHGTDIRASGNSSCCVTQTQTLNSSFLFSFDDPNITHNEICIYIYMKTLLNMVVSSARTASSSDRSNLRATGSSLQAPNDKPLQTTRSRPDSTLGFRNGFLGLKVYGWGLGSNR